MTEELSTKPEPFLRWAGGKRQLARQLAAELPDDLSQRHYHEPFLGAGSLFFEITPRNATLSDANEALIRTYQWIVKNPERIHVYLRDHAFKHGPSYYYYIRDLYNISRDSAAQAARFIYLNRSCFNGIYRVNTKGEFNVPIGDKKTLALPDLKQIRAVKLALTNSQLHCRSFETSSAMISRGDFVYFDPPYPALNGTAYFAHYTTSRFGHDTQLKLASAVKRLDREGALILMSNADTPLIRKLYAGFHMKAIPVRRYVTCKSVKHAVNELLIKNY